MNARLHMHDVSLSPHQMEASLFAKNLEYLLADCCTQSDVSPVSFAEVAERFDALRRYEMLPRGRDNRAQRLNAAQIAAAILGFVPSNPHWAGHAAVILRDLRPVGGVGASFHGAVNLLTAMEKLLADRSARQDLPSLSISVAECGTNSNGFATLTYRWFGERTQAYFVPKEAVSQLQPGAESLIDVDYLHALASRFIVFNHAFIDRVARAVEQSVAFPGSPMGDGSEYDAEEAAQARYKALGVQSGSRYLNVGVDTQVTWPKKEMLIQFGQYHLVLMPKTKEHTQSIHVDLYANRLTDKQAGTVINRFLSLLTWCDDAFAVKQGGGSGSPVPIAVARRDLAFATAYDWVFDRRISTSDENTRALALYREGRNAAESGLASYAVLSYFKVIEIRYEKSKKAKVWIAANFSGVTAAHVTDPQMKHFLATCGSEAPEEYIWESCRIAVAHASTDHPSDADDSDEITRLYSASYVLRLLARHLIAHELGVSDSIYSGD